MTHKRHILHSQQYDRPALEQLFAATDEMIRIFEDLRLRETLRKTLVGRMMYAVFYEPSTRTRFSFCHAAEYLGMKALWTEDAEKFSSGAKGETLEDTIRTLAQYEPDVIVLRHKKMGAANQAAEIIDKGGYPTSIINAGDGGGQHPTQALLDIYTIWRELHRVDGLVITIGGDLANGRTARSLTYLLARFMVKKIIFIAPNNLKMGNDILDHLRKHHVAFEESNNVNDALAAADVVYWTRIQDERGSSNTTLDLKITKAKLNIMKRDAILLHPLPRVDEIATEVDADPRAAYFRQARNGMLTRMVLLEQLCK